MISLSVSDTSSRSIRTKKKTHVKCGKVYGKEYEKGPCRVQCICRLLECIEVQQGPARARQGLPWLEEAHRQQANPQE